MKEQVSLLIQQGLDRLIEKGHLQAGTAVTVQVERTRDPAHGDLASNVALTLAKRAGMPPRQLATLLCEHLPDSPLIAATEIAGPGFINFFLSADSSVAILGDILERGRAFGRSD